MIVQVSKKLIVLFVLIFLVGGVVGYVVNQLQNPKSEVFNPDWNEPPALIKDVENVQDILDDLEFLDCVLINGVYQFGTYGNIIRMENYVEFRRVAYNTKIVFYGYENYVFYCYTVLEGFFVSYSYP